MLESVVNVVPIENLAVHFHDTYGQALANILVSLQVISSFPAWFNCSEHTSPQKIYAYELVFMWRVSDRITTYIHRI